VCGKEKTTQHVLNVTLPEFSGHALKFEF